MLDSLGPTLFLVFGRFPKNSSSVIWPLLALNLAVLVDGYLLTLLGRRCSVCSGKYGIPN